MCGRGRSGGRAKARPYRFRRVEVVGIGVDRGADAIAPTVAAKCFCILMLGDLNALHHDLGEVGEG